MNIGSKIAKDTSFLMTFLLIACILGVPSTGKAANRTIRDDETISLPGNVHPLARPEFETGAAPPSLPMERIILALRRTADKQVELVQFLDELHDPSSPNYHRWLTPDEFGERFGASSEDIDAITGWLTSHGFTVDEVAKGRTWINFSGTVAHVQRAFHTTIRTYRVDDHLRHANAEDPSIPQGLADVVAGVVSLNDFPRKPMHHNIGLVTQPEYTSGSAYYMSSNDFATIYDVNTLYNAGIDGTGQSIAIVGRIHPSDTNWTTFRSIMGLPANPPQVIVNGTDPGDIGSDENMEADLDVEWSGAVAKNATILFITSKSTDSTDGVDLSAQYIVNNNLAPVMSTSFGACESEMGTAENSFYNSLWQQAAAQGITSFVASGDSGAAGCDLGSDTRGSRKAVSGLASTPYNVAVGGTQFDEGSETYWNTSNSSGYSSAISYIPEVAWNESGSVSGGSGLWSTGGGASSIYTKPSWQAATGVPSDGKRDVPDVSLSAAGHDAYLVVTQGELYAVRGTSASSPAFAGLMALVVQKTGERQGNANVRLYQLADGQYSGNGTTVFHDTTSGDNTVPGVTGYSCTTGYDRATGLGSVIASALIDNWLITVTASVSDGTGGTITPATTTVAYGESLTLTLFPSTGYHLASLTDNGTDATSSVTDNTYTITDITASHTVIAAFAVNTYTIDASVGSGSGTVTPTSTAIEYGGSYPFTFSPNPNYSVEDVLLDGTSIYSSLTKPGTNSGSDRAYTLTAVTADHALEVHFVSCPGDINGDKARGMPDYNLFKSAYGSVSGDANWNSRADLNQDGRVGMPDYSLFKSNYGKSCP